MAVNNKLGKAVAVGWDSPVVAAAAECGRFPLPKCHLASQMPTAPASTGRQQLQVSQGFCKQLGSGKGPVW